MRVQMLVGVFYEGRPLMPPEIHDLPTDFAKGLIRERRAAPAPDEVQVAIPEIESRDPVAVRGVRRR
jgi:hypothetical protein